MSRAVIPGENGKFGVLGIANILTIQGSLCWSSNLLSFTPVIPCLCTFGTFVAFKWVSKKIKVPLCLLSSPKTEIYVILLETSFPVQHKALGGGEETILLGKEIFSLVK